MKQFLETTLTIDSVTLPVRFTQSSIQEVLLPLLRRLTVMQRAAGRRLLVFVGAPAGAGKSVLLAYLEQLSHSQPDLCPVQALGLDGFHYPNAYLQSHRFIYNGCEYGMRQVKGWPETFDVEKFAATLSMLRQNDTVSCPIYDRNVHEPVENGLLVTADIVFVEGLWMLYDEGAWGRIQALADYRVMLLARVPVLRERAVARKIRGGMTPEAARAFFGSADLPAVQRIVSHMADADLYLESLWDDDVVDLGNRPRTLAPYCGD